MHRRRRRRIADTSPTYRRSIGEIPPPHPLGPHLRVPWESYPSSGVGDAWSRGREDSRAVHRGTQCANASDLSSFVSTHAS
eukprot:9487224-Pyramimonas_sp.AAC.1